MPSFQTKEIFPEDFPKSLLQAKNCPKKLYYRGTWNQEIFDNTLAMVGSRRMSRYGQNTVLKFMPDLVAAKVTIISGFMYGIDSMAHDSCLKLGGKTIAVLGGGLAAMRNSTNEKLYDEILNNNGLIVSEYPDDFKGTLWTFPQRNRIVAGLATRGTLVIEAGLKSGSLITCRIGHEMGKKVWAVPGNIDSPTSEGTNYLIKNNQAEMCIGIGDILGQRNEIEQTNWLDEPDNEEKQIIDCLKRGYNSLDEIKIIVGWDIKKLNTKISMMSLGGLLEESGGKYYPAVSKSIIR